MKLVLLHDVEQKVLLQYISLLETGPYGLKLYHYVYMSWFNLKFSSSIGILLICWSVSLKLTKSVTEWRIRNEGRLWNYTSCSLC